MTEEEYYAAIINEIAQIRAIMEEIKNTLTIEEDGETMNVTEVMQAVCYQCNN